MTQLALPFPKQSPLSWLDEYALWSWLYWNEDGYVG